MGYTFTPTYSGLLSVRSSTGLWIGCYTWADCFALGFLGE